MVVGVGEQHLSDKLQRVSKCYDFRVGRGVLCSVRLRRAFGLSCLDPAVVLQCLRKYHTPLGDGLGEELE